MEYTGPCDSPELLDPCAPYLTCPACPHSKCFLQIPPPMFPSLLSPAGISHPTSLQYLGKENHSSFLFLSVWIRIKSCSWVAKTALIHHSEGSLVSLTRLGVFFSTKGHHGLPSCLCCACIRLPLIHPPSPIHRWFLLTLHLESIPLYLLLSPEIRPLHLLLIEYSLHRSNSFHSCYSTTSFSPNPKLTFQNVNWAHIIP